MIITILDTSREASRHSQQEVVAVRGHLSPRRGQRRGTEGIRYIYTLWLMFLRGGSCSYLMFTDEQGRRQGGGVFVELSKS